MREAKRKQARVYLTRCIGKLSCASLIGCERRTADSEFADWSKAKESASERAVNTDEATVEVEELPIPPLPATPADPS
jgi:hypothetical protein